ncbi:polysaccharide deacetylase family protein [Streptomyces sp. HU2014]|uniref:Polysaccharide deacetylase n=1 Tax=Streptomyces albireticuli TaxID=1940 RepID=A0A1Z2L5L7_9ACTN|nr:MULTISPECIES: polysaccharide deacetylase family protein [Streptomyces]ARZ69511.1 polysaccharide deacetylase [Streptomyces albireticuli]UQI43135.1 polysaccharide deacetylase family protein [Streptomyces sp. HU2014]
MSPSISGLRAPRRRLRTTGPACAAALLLAGLLAGCSGSPGSSSGPDEAAGSPSRTGTGAASPSAAPDPETYRRWGLDKPLAAPPKPPAAKLTDGMRPGDAPKVVKRVPTQDKVVFVTFDDGAEKDPEFVKMAKDLKLPFSMFLTDDIARAGRGYDYFEQLRGEAGAGGKRNGVHNHTLSHPNLRTLSPEAQRREVCGQQEALEKRFGTRPPLFRPPYGNLDDATLTAAGGCGVKAVVLWEATMQINDMRYADGGKLRAGDIVLAHFRGPRELKGTSMTEHVTNMLRSIQRQGFTVARLEDYV